MRDVWIDARKPKAPPTIRCATCSRPFATPRAREVHRVRIHAPSGADAYEALVRKRSGA